MFGTKNNARWFFVLAAYNFICLTLYYFLGHPIIKLIYDGSAPFFLYDLIRDRSGHSLTDYYQLGDQSFFSILLASDLILIALYVFLTSTLLMGVMFAVFLLASMETVYSLSFLYPSITKILPHFGLEKVYYSKGRAIIPEGKKLKAYDPEITYTLAPNSSFTVVAPEYQSIYNVNSVGLRDDESSLDKPEIIILGDSEAMGWGVSKSETYEEIIEKQTGFKVLNAAIASFATVRQMLLLNRLDTSNLKYLIIEYHNNDYRENKYFYEHGRLDITPKEKYEERVAQKDKSRRYYPGKYLIHAVLGLFDRFFKGYKEPLKSKNSAKYFLNAVSSASIVDLHGVTIITIGLAPKIFQENSQNEYPDHIAKMLFFDMESLRRNCSNDCNYPFDGHRNPKAYKIIAEGLIQLIRQNESHNANHRRP